jgi:hypothetical protein
VFKCSSPMKRLAPAGEPCHSPSSEARGNLLARTIASIADRNGLSHFEVGVDPLVSSGVCPLLSSTLGVEYFVDTGPSGAAF